MFDDKALFECLKERGMSVRELAERMNISRVTLYRKITGESDFTRREIQTCRGIFGREECERIFFAPDVA